MTDAKQIMGMGCSMVGFCVCLLLGEEVLAKTFFSIFCASLGLPIAAKGIAKLVK